MKLFSIKELLFLHFKIIDSYGGAHGVRDKGRIESVVAAPAQHVFGQALYPSIYDKAAVYIRSIIADHPFVDGNKRTAITAGVIFLQRNGLTMTASAVQLEDFAVQVAVDHLDITAIADWLREHSQS